MKLILRIELIRALLLLGPLLLFSIPVAAVEWPQEVTASEGTIIVYQPQPESLVGNVLKGRAAMSLELEGVDNPIFGAFWFEARLDNDSDAGVAIIRDMTVKEVRWPESKDSDEQRFTKIIEAAIPENGFEISIDDLSASLETAETSKKSLENLKNDPPIILFSEQLSVLLQYDGEPRYSEIENSPYDRVLNTAFAVVRKKGSNDYYLSSGKYWYQANAALGPWTQSNSPPKDLQKMLADVAEDVAAPDKPPAIITADKATELIVTLGKPDWQSLADGKLLYVKNTETAWLRDLSTNNMYVLLSGRWFRSKSEKGPWTFVRSDELPDSFTNIPPESDIGGLRVSVAGTPEAKDAMLDAQIPKTAAIERSKASMSVEYDGKPKFDKIIGTEVSYATNTAGQVLLIDGDYYAVDNGVWFTSKNASGPWVVSDSIPDDKIQKIPPSSPVYNTTSVRIYQSTPQVVYVGYTPGYMWSYPYYGVPVYGTGYYYPPYYGRYYYPRPPTWGMNIGYNPWTGWNVGVSWSNGFFSMGVSFGGGYHGGYYPGRCCGGYYGGGYHHHHHNTVINTGNINIGNNVNIGNRTNVKNNFQRNNNNINRSRTNIYNQEGNRTRNVNRTTAQRNFQQARPATARENNVYADRSGNVARRNKDAWESRSNGQWKSNRTSTGTPAKRASSGMHRSSLDHSGLNRANTARQRGASRRMSRPAGGRHRR